MLLIVGIEAAAGQTDDAELDEAPIQELEPEDSPLVLENETKTENGDQIVVPELQDEAVGSEEHPSDVLAETAEHHQVEISQDRQEEDVPATEMSTSVSPNEADQEISAQEEHAVETAEIPVERKLDDTPAGTPETTTEDAILATNDLPQVERHEIKEEDTDGNHADSAPTTEQPTATIEHEEESVAESPPEANDEAELQPQSLTHLTELPTNVLVEPMTEPAPVSSLQETPPEVADVEPELLGHLESHVDFESSLNQTEYFDEPVSTPDPTEQVPSQITVHDEHPLQTISHEITAPPSDATDQYTHSTNEDSADSNLEISAHEPLPETIGESTEEVAEPEPEVTEHVQGQSIQPSPDSILGDTVEGPTNEPTPEETDPLIEQEAALPTVGEELNESNVTAPTEHEEETGVHLDHTLHEAPEDAPESEAPVVQLSESPSEPDPSQIDVSFGGEVDASSLELAEEKSQVEADTATEVVDNSHDSGKTVQTNNSDTTAASVELEQRPLDSMETFEHKASEPEHEVAPETLAFDMADIANEAPEPEVSEMKIAPNLVHDDDAKDVKEPLESQVQGHPETSDPGAAADDNSSSQQAASTSISELAPAVEEISKDQSPVFPPSTETNIETFDPQVAPVDEHTPLDGPPDQTQEAEQLYTNPAEDDLTAQHHEEVTVAETATEAAPHVDEKDQPLVQKEREGEQPEMKQETAQMESQSDISVDQSHSMGLEDATANESLSEEAVIQPDVAETVNIEAKTATTPEPALDPDTSELPSDFRANEPPISAEVSAETMEHQDSTSGESEGIVGEEHSSDHGQKSDVIQRSENEDPPEMKGLPTTAAENVISETPSDALHEEAALDPIPVEDSAVEPSSTEPKISEPSLESVKVDELANDEPILDDATKSEIAEDINESTGITHDEVAKEIAIMDEAPIDDEPVQELEEEIPQLMDEPPVISQDSVESAELEDDAPAQDFVQGANEDQESISEEVGNEVCVDLAMLIL